MEFSEFMGLSVLIVGIITMIIFLGPIFLNTLKLPSRMAYVNNFCISNGFQGHSGGQIFSPLRCITNSYEPDVPISCYTDSITGEYFCELEPERIEYCFECKKYEKPKGR